MPQFKATVHLIFSALAPLDQRRVHVTSLRPKLLAIALSVLSAAAAYASTLILPNNRKLQYTGRIDFSNPAAPQLSWPGTSVTGNFTGSSLAIRLDDQFGTNFFNVFLDDDYAHPTVLPCVQGDKTYPVASNLPPGKHRFLLTKRTEGGDGATTLLGIELADAAEILRPPKRPRHKMEIYGDSISSGMGNEAPDGDADNIPKDKNNFLAYGPIAARALNAELHVISQSGIGIMISWADFTMPQFYGQLSAVGKNDTRWDFSKWTPDVVVINLFQNDCWLIDVRHRIDPPPTDEERIKAYVDFVKTIRSRYPKAYIICALGSMDATQPGSKWPGYVSAAVEQIKKEKPKGKIDTLFFDFTGYEAHPRVAQHQANAAKLAAFVRQKMGW